MRAAALLCALVAADPGCTGEIDPDLVAADPYHAVQIVFRFLSQDLLAVLLLIAFTILTLGRHFILEELENKYSTNGPFALQFVTIIVFDCLIFRGVTTVGSVPMTHLIIFFAALSGVVDLLFLLATRFNANWETGWDDPNNMEGLQLPSFLAWPEEGDKNPYDLPKDDNYLVPRINFYSIEAPGMFGDLACPISKCLATFVVQVMLIIYLIRASLVENVFILDSVCMPMGNTFFWCTPLIQILAGASMGKKFTEDAEYWQFLWTALTLNSNAVIREGDKGFNKEKVPVPGVLTRPKKKQQGNARPTTTDVGFRCFLSAIVNTFAYDFIIYLLPLLLCHASGSMGFVGSTFGIVWIATLDDAVSHTPVVLHYSVLKDMSLPTPWEWADDDDDDDADDADEDSAFLSPR